MPRPRSLEDFETVVYGPFHRTENETTQTAETMRLVLESGELGGYGPLDSPLPAAKAHPGPLPAGRRGFEFYAFAPPDRPYGGVMYWHPRDDGRVWRDGELAKVKVLVTRVTQELV